MIFTQIEYKAFDFNFDFFEIIINNDAAIFVIFTNDNLIDDVIKFAISTNNFSIIIDFNFVNKRIDVDDVELVNKRVDVDDVENNFKRRKLRKQRQLISIEINDELSDLELNSENDELKSNDENFRVSF